MDTIGERVKMIRKSPEVNLTLEKFGEKLGVGKNAISRIETGKSNLTEQMFKSICREYNVNPAWLHDGVGDMFLDLDQDGIIAGWVGKVLKDKPDSFRKSVISVMATWTEDDWEWIEKQARAIVEGAKESNNSSDDVPEVVPTIDETSILDAFERGDDEFQPNMSEEKLRKELGL